MKNRWSKGNSEKYVKEYGKQYGKELVLRVYTSRLIGAEKALVMHGGGNTSVKTIYKNILGESLTAIFIKASGFDMYDIGPEGFTGLDLDYLKRLRNLPELSDENMINEFRTHMFDYKAATPSLETLVHAFIPKKFIDHTHPDAILTLTNLADAEKMLREAIDKDIAILEYIKPGFILAQAVAEAFESNQSLQSSSSGAIILLNHGLITWGESAHESYKNTIDIVTKAERYIANRPKITLKVTHITKVDKAEKRYIRIAPIIRGMLAEKTGDEDRSFKNIILTPLINREILNFVDSMYGNKLALTPPLTTDYLVRTKSLPLWIDSPDFGNIETFKKSFSKALTKYAKEYIAYVKRDSNQVESGLIEFDSLPRIIMMPGLGAICIGKNIYEAMTASDITAQAVTVKTNIAKIGNYSGLSEKEIFGMEYRSYQHAKLGEIKNNEVLKSKTQDFKYYLSRRIAIITGAAGAIGAGICRVLLENGMHVAITDIPGEHLDSIYREFESEYGRRAIAVPLDVTDQDSVTKGFNQVVKTWGGIDLVVINAGIAHVSRLSELKLDDFRRLEKVNVEGTLNVITDSAHLFKHQETEGDIVLISTKNVFSPGASFGAYSVTKAASHQLARIASIELADMGVRVNMVSPDAIFSEGIRKSGLWQEIGPDRMRARGLNEKGLEEYYRNRNLLKARITSTHVANAVLFFASRQTPTTGATIPVDGGLPDATPR